MSNFYWIECIDGSVPENALKAGTDSDGAPLYVGRCNLEGDTVLGKVAPNRGWAYFPWGGNEHLKKTYEVLCGGPGAWVLATDGEIPEDAVEGCNTADGESLYVGRVMHGGTITPGKVQPSHNVCYISYAGKELPFSEYEVLVRK